MKCKITWSRSMCRRSCGWSSVTLKYGQMPRTFTETFRHIASLVGQHKTKNTASVKANSRAYIVSADLVVTDWLILCELFHSYFTLQWNFRCKLASEWDQGSFLNKNIVRWGGKNYFIYTSHHNGLRCKLASKWNQGNFPLATYRVIASKSHLLAQ